MLNPDPQNGPEPEVSPQARADELSALASYLLKKMEGERFELAKKLHDELGGMITAAKMDMQWLSAHIGTTLDPKATEKFNSVVQMLNQAMILKRSVVENLRPSLLDHFGLAVAMGSHFDEHCKAAGLECMSTLPDDALQLDAGAQLALFRVAQEVLQGVITRGGAKHVEVVVEPEGEGYTMTIGDDGAAMDTDLTRAMPSARHRVEFWGGRVEAESRAGAGNQVRVYVPRSTAG